MDLTLFYKILFVVLTYLFGSIPVAYIIYKVRKGSDIRMEGSGNVGGTNVARTLGPAAGVLTIILDAIKGFIPIMAVYLIFGKDILMAGIASVAVIIGHDFPAYIRFRGGKGIAASLGAIIGICSFPFSGQEVYLRIAPIFIIIAAAAIFFLIFRIVSVCSIAGAIAAPLSFYFTDYPAVIVITAVIWTVLALITHRSNIKRLIRKEEKKIRGKGA